MTKLDIVNKGVYIAGPMRGRECYNFEEFFVAAHFVKKAGFGAINPAQIDTEKMFEGWQYTEDKYPDVLFNDLQVIKDKVFCIYLLEDWEYSPGAKAEVAYARAIGIPIIEQMWVKVAMKTEGISMEKAMELKINQAVDNAKGKI
jgi:hypothetical protein